MALNIDLAPTFLDIAGVKPNKIMDGTSLMDVAVGTIYNSNNGFVLLCVLGKSSISFSEECYHKKVFCLFKLFIRVYKEFLFYFLPRRVMKPIWKDSFLVERGYVLFSHPLFTRANNLM